jgi:uncharacterized membrane protein
MSIADEARTWLATLRRDRRRIVALELTGLAWVFLVLAMAVSPPRNLDLGSFSGSIGAAIGVFVGTLVRSINRNESNAFLRATLVSGAVVVGTASVVAVGLRLQGRYGQQDPGAFFRLGAVGLVLLIAATLLGTRSRADQYKIGAFLAGTFAALLAVFALLSASLEGQMPAYEEPAVDGPPAILLFAGAVALGGLTLLLGLRHRSHAADPANAPT